MGLPALPQLRTIEGAVGTCIKEIRLFLGALQKIKFLSGKETTVTFTASDVSGNVVKRVITGLGYAPTGYMVVGGHTFFDLKQIPTPASETDTSVIYLQANAASTYTIWVY